MFHRWIGTDDPAHDTCLVCGGMWRNSDPDSVVLEVDTMQGIDGTPATDCTGDPAQCHHYAGECPEDECRRDELCNCLHCYS